MNHSLAWLAICSLMPLTSELGRTVLELGSKHENIATEGLPPRIDFNSEGRMVAGLGIHLVDAEGGTYGPLLPGLHEAAQQLCPRSWHQVDQGHRVSAKNGEPPLRERPAVIMRRWKHRLVRDREVQSIAAAMTLITLVRVCRVIIVLKWSYLKSIEMRRTGWKGGTQQSITIPILIK